MFIFIALFAKDASDASVVGHCFASSAVVFCKVARSSFRLMSSVNQSITTTSRTLLCSPRRRGPVCLQDVLRVWRWCCSCHPSCALIIVTVMSVVFVCNDYDDADDDDADDDDDVIRPRLDGLTCLRTLTGGRHVL